MSISSEQIHEIVHAAMITSVVAVVAACAVCLAQEVRYLLASRSAQRLNRLKIERDYALYSQQIMLEQTRLIVELDRARQERRES